MTSCLPLLHPGPRPVNPCPAEGWRVSVRWAPDGTRTVRCPLCGATPVVRDLNSATQPTSPVPAHERRVR